MRQQSVVKYLGNDNSTAHFSAARGRVYLYPESQIEKSTDRRKDYYKFWNEKAEELCSSPCFDKYSKQELHGIIDSHWRIHATQICIRDAEQEQQLIEPLSHEFRAHKLLLSAKTVSKNVDLLKEEKRKISHLNDELTTLRAGPKTLDTKKEMQNKEKELKNLLTNLKLAQDRLRKSVDGLSKFHLQVTSSAGTSGDKKTKSKAEFNVQLEIDEKEQALFAQEVKDESW